MSGGLAETLLPALRAYLGRRPHLLGAAVALQPLAQGEYHLNFLASAGGADGRGAVVRVNTGSQEINAGERQIVYEATALQLLEPLGIAPCLLHVDPAPEEFATLVGAGRVRAR